MCLGLEKVLGSSRDPSPPLPFWDKIRLMYHGRLTMIVNELKVKLHASLDPYNTTEEMELNWYNTAMDWTNGELYFYSPGLMVENCQIIILIFFQPNLFSKVI